jgi:quercetin dioxygenase-like cupin family protein
MTMQDVKQIKIGKHMIGIVGLKSTFEELVRDNVDQTDAALSRMLLERLAEKNYIPEKVRENYGRAFVREFRKFLSHAVEDEGAEGLVIKVLGAGCVICDSLENTVMETLTTMGLAADLEHIRDTEQISEYLVKGTPALVINGKVMCAGRNPSNYEIRKWLEEAGYNKPKGNNMDKQVFIKNIPFSEPQQLTELVEYEEGRVVSRTFAQNPTLSLTLFAFDKGEGVSTHTAPGDAMVQVLDGEATVNIDGKKMTVDTGQVVVMPANIPHAVIAVKRFKMILTVVKKPVTIQS